jgi:hypothetical protein
MEPNLEMRAEMVLLFAEKISSRKYISAKDIISVLE